MRIVLILPLSLLLAGLLFWLAGYIAHCFLHVLNETAQGHNEVPVRWPSDGFIDRLWNAVYLAALVAIALIPAAVLVRVLGIWQEDVHSILIVLVLATVVWLLLPIPFLSVLSGRHHWEIFRWTVIRALASRARFTGAFYAASAPLLIGCLLVVYFAVAGWIELQEAATASTVTWFPDAVRLWSWLFVLPLSGALCAATVLIYARLLGRLTWLLDLAEVEEESPPPNEAVPAPGHLVGNHDTLEPVSGEPPSPVETYGLLEEDPPSALPVGPIPERELPVSVTIPATRADPMTTLAPPVEKMQPSAILDIPATGPAPPSGPRYLPLSVVPFQRRVLDRADPGLPGRTVPDKADCSLRVVKLGERRGVSPTWRRKSR